MAKRDWSTTAASNNTADGDIDLEGSTASIRTADNSMRAIMQKDAIWRDDNNGSRSTAGSSNTYTYTSSGSAATPADGFSAYATGDTLTIQANHTNTGASTLNVDSVGAMAIRKYRDGAEAALAASDIISAAPMSLIYDADANSAAGAWILLNPAHRLPPPSFTSSEQTVTLDTLLAVAHGLGAVPSLFTVVLRCKTADLGYGVGEEVLISGMATHTGASDQGVDVSADSTNIRIAQGANLTLISQSTLNNTIITTSSWRWVIRAWL